jgi:hypothetical protein
MSNVPTYETREEFENVMRGLMREVRDERPSGWQAAAEACVAYFRYYENTGANWSGTEAARLDEEAERLVRELDGGK